MVKAYLYSFDEKDCASDKWDYGLLKEIFDKYNIEQIKVNSLPDVDRAFVVVPGPQNLGHEEDVNKELQKIGRVVLFFTGDEEVRFNLTKINHPNIEIWIQTPHKQHKKYNKLSMMYILVDKSHIQDESSCLMPCKPSLMPFLSLQQALHKVITQRTTI